MKDPKGPKIDSDIRESDRIRIARGENIRGVPSVIDNNSTLGAKMASWRYPIRYDRAGTDPTTIRLVLEFTDDD